MNDRATARLVEKNYRAHQLFTIPPARTAPASTTETSTTAGESDAT
ncbi:MAG: hypothetical protein ACRDP6_23270 [Actinoallomurus sp.]